ncbi:putative RNA-directed DNA polymerase from transposon X-element [Trichonephila inaurata madagascariensis]|uniref:Putative RNA-directed DNA polymerase from transposon X-element n=1 Tax=Trichonephila inaurata madagascariensis TaxID=2747483 RepID=A0A8X6X652_9ARAC|nr:putative RNA-directed DNA polymerase from transposon X-element [Trichonephila inaurata madagascariensis]
MERMITSRLSWFLESNNLLSPTRTGFRKWMSTNQQVTLLSQSIKNALDPRCSVLAVFVGFETAFDKVCFLSQRSCTTRFGNSVTSFKQSETGFPQDTVINPLLLNIFIDDMPGILTSYGLTNAALFADDFAVWCCASKEEQLNTVMNKFLERLEAWCLENNMTINLEKTTSQ